MTSTRRSFLKNGVMAAAMTGLLQNPTVLAEEQHIDYRNRVGLNFIRSDYGRPGNYTFLHKGVWLAEQFQKMGLRWNRLNVSWVVVQPTERQYNWEPYDRVVHLCRHRGINVLATLGGHFDKPPVPLWSGDSLLDVVTNHPQRLETYIEAWVNRYKGSVTHWEILNEPGHFHKGLTVSIYVNEILKPAYKIIKAADPQAVVLACSYNNLPVLGNKEEFWDEARGYYDLANYHCYVGDGKVRTDTSGAPEEARIRSFIEEMQRHDEGNRHFWVTETGWSGTSSAFVFDNSPINHTPDASYRSELGREVIANAVMHAEDAKRAIWMEDMYRRLLLLPGCEKVFLWASMDEFMDGYQPDQLYKPGGEAAEQRYQRLPKDDRAKECDLWGLIAGDGSWRKSAFSLQRLLQSHSKVSAE